MDVDLAKKKLSEQPEGTISIWMIKEYNKKIERHNELNKISNSVYSYINDVKIKSNMYIYEGKGKISEFNELFKKQIDFVKQTRETIDDDVLVNVPFTDYNIKEMIDLMNQSLNETISFEKEINNDFKRVNDISNKAIKYSDEASKYSINNLNDTDKLQKTKYIAEQMVNAGKLLVDILQLYRSELKLIKYTSESISNAINKLSK